MRSRTISRDQRSPKRSSDRLTGQPERGFGLGTGDMRAKVAKIACEMQASLKKKSQRSLVARISRINCVGCASIGSRVQGDLRNENRPARKESPLSRLLCLPVQPGAYRPTSFCKFSG